MADLARVLQVDQKYPKAPSTKSHRQTQIKLFGLIKISK